MNLNNLLSYLVESVNIEELRSKVGDSVPESVLDSLASKMKNNKYDNIAMAIIKGLQRSLNTTAEDQKVAQKRLDYLASRVSMIYSILKKLKIGDSAFNADSVISEYIESDKTPSTFWKEKYSEANNKPVPMSKKEKKFNTPGLDTARFKDLGNCFAILPKNFKTTGEFGFKVLDKRKSWEELKQLSSDMAQKDTSGLPEAKVNHWCVASSNSHMYDSYKDGWRNGEFVIFVKKDKDGSPDWNNRWLAFFSKYNGSTEIADKFDRHISVDDLPSDGAKFFKNMMKQKTQKERKTGGDSEEKEVLRRMETNDERVILDVGYNQVADKMVDYVFDMARKAKKFRAKEIRNYLKKELKARNAKNFKELSNIFSNRYWFHSRMGGERATIVSAHEAPDKKAFQFGAFKYVGKDLNDVFDFLDKCIADPSLIEKNIDENFAKYRANKPANITYSDLKFGEPTEKMINALKGNKEIIKKYLAKKNEEAKGRNIGSLIIPSPNSSRYDQDIKVYFGNYRNRNEVIVHYYWRQKEIGDRDDPKTFDRLKETIEKIISGKRAWWED